MKERPILCKPVPGGMTEQEKAEASLLYNPNTTTEMASYRFKIQDAICEYNQFKPSQVQERRDFLANIFGKIGKNCNILPPFKCDYGFRIEVGENFFANYNFIVLDGNYCRFGDNVWIAPNVSILAAGHPLDMQDRIDGWEYAFPVNVGNNVWIGGSVTILGGVTIGDNAVVQAEGGSFASGIGGGNGGTGTEIVIMENAQVTAVGKENAADIGNGTLSDTEKQPNNVNTDGLTTGKVIYGRDHGPQNPDCPVEQKPAASSASAAPVRKNGGVTTNGYKKGYLWSQGYITRTLFKVENGAGMKPFWSEEIREGILTITAENEPVVFTTWLNGLKYLYEMGIRTIVIKTGNCETTLDVAKLIAENASEYILIQKGENATLTLDGKSAEIE